MSALEEQLQQLMVASQNGDKVAYRKLLIECDKWLRRYYSNKIHYDALDELVQETLISLHKKRASFDPKRKFIPWLATIARYRWIDYLRKLYRKGETSIIEETIAAPEDDSVTSKLSLDALLEKLPEKQVEAIRLVKITGYSIAEASKKTGQSESAIKVNIHRGLKKMGSLFEAV